MQVTPPHIHSECPESRHERPMLFRILRVTRTQECRSQLDTNILDQKAARTLRVCTENMDDKVRVVQT